MGNLRIITFTLSDQYYGIETNCVKRVFPAFSTTLIPNPLPFVMGMVNVQGIALPVFDIRPLLNLKINQLSVTDSYIEVDLCTHHYLFLANRIVHVSEYEKKDILPTEERFIKHNESISGVIRQNDKLVVLLNMEKLIQ